MQNHFLIYIYISLSLSLSQKCFLERRLTARDLGLRPQWCFPPPEVRVMSRGHMAKLLNGYRYLPDDLTLARLVFRQRTVSIQLCLHATRGERYSFWLYLYIYIYTTFYHVFVGLLFASARKGCKRTSEEIAALPAEVVSKRSRVSLALVEAGVEEGRKIQEAGLANWGDAAGGLNMYIYIYIYF